MYKKIFSWVLAVTFQPNRAWSIIANKEDKAEEKGVDYKDDPFFANYLYPLIGLVTLASFLSVFTHKEFVLELALKNSIRTVVAYIGGFYLASYYIKKFCSKFVDMHRRLRRWQHFIGYASAYMYALTIIRMLIPDLFFLYVFVIYTLRIVWEGLPAFMKVETKDRLKVTVVSTIFIIGFPILVELLVEVMMPGLHV
ncbi:MAG: Yip1 family protein [Parabacteroides sp.]|nr:Yip1 family protein [Parabacteroides sp.]